MTTQDALLRPVHGENEDRRDYRDIFREFLSHLGRVSRPPAKAVKEQRRRAGK